MASTRKRVTDWMIRFEKGTEFDHKNNFHQTGTRASIVETEIRFSFSQLRFESLTDVSEKIALTNNVLLILELAQHNTVQL